MRNYVHSVALKCWESAYQLDQATPWKQTIPLRDHWCASSGWGESGVCVRWLRPSRQCSGAGGGRERARRLWFSSSVSVFRRSVEEEAPRCSGPSKTEPTQAKPKQRSSKLASPRIASAGTWEFTGGWQRVIMPTVGTPASDAALVILIYRTL